MSYGKVKAAAVWAVLALFVLFAHESTAAQNEATLEAGDLIFVQVHRHPELSTTTQIDEGGKIQLPYIGNVSIGGLQEKEAGARVSTAFESILKNPRVTLTRSGSRPMGDRMPLMQRTSEMTTQVVHLQNSNAEVLYTALSGMASAGGSVSYDPDTNTLILTDSPNTLQNMIAVVQELDQTQSQVVQVHIETRIAEVQSTAVKEVGVRWFAAGDQASGGYYPNPRQNQIVNGVRGINDPLYNERVQSTDRNNVAGGREYLDESNWDRRMQVPLHVPAPGQMFFGYMNTGIDLGVFLDALVSDNKAEMLATPYIRTVNHKTAQIKMTDEYPFVELGSAGLNSISSTRFLDIGIVLEVTPHVRRTNSGETYVQMELEPEVSSLSGIANGVPIRSVRSSHNIANVLDGQTLVIGGIVQNDGNDVVQKVPGLGNMPLLGRLFKHKERSNVSTELMIFVTPTVYEQPGAVTWNRTLELSDAVAPMDIRQPLAGQVEARKE